MGRWNGMLSLAQVDAWLIADPFNSLKSYVKAKSYFVGKEYLQIAPFKNVCLGLLRKGGKVPLKKYSLSGLGWEWLAFFYSLQNNVYSQVGHESKQTKWRWTGEQSWY